MGRAARMAISSLTSIDGVPRCPHNNGASHRRDADDFAAGFRLPANTNTSPKSMLPILCAHSNGLRRPTRSGGSGGGCCGLDSGAHRRDNGRCRYSVAQLIQAEAEHE